MVARPIVAVATGAGPAAIGVLRVSGAGAWALCQRRLSGLSGESVPRQLRRARLLDEAGEPLDDVLVAHFVAPRSYTGEEAVEIHCHGGSALIAAAQESLLTAGARLAEPGEFTRRAVRNGRLDLLEAEAIAALLEADENESLKAAQRFWREQAPQLREQRRRIHAALAEVRGAHDHPLETSAERLSWAEQARSLAGEVRQLVGRPSLERRSLEGARVVLLGPANAGKSSLLNALLGEERALVDAQPGTTRDLVTAPLRLEGRRLTLCDTAGLRAAEGLEARGVQRAVEAAASADLVLWVEDVSLPAGSPPESIEVDLAVSTKGDLPRHPDHPADRLLVSAHDGRGLRELRFELARRLTAMPGALSERQARLLSDAARQLDWAGDSTAGTEDLRAAALEQAAELFDQLCGVEPAQAAEVDEVFQRFCIGK